MGTGRMTMTTSAQNHEAMHVWSWSHDVDLCRVASVSCKSLIVLEKFLPFFKAVKSPWKWIWCLKVLEFSLRGPWKFLNSKVVSNSIMWKTMQSLENYEQSSEHQYCLLTWCHISWVTCWKLQWSRFEKVVRVLESPWKILDFISAKHWPSCLWITKIVTAVTWQRCQQLRVMMCSPTSQYLIQ